MPRDHTIDPDTCGRDATARGLRAASVLVMCSLFSLSGLAACGGGLPFPGLEADEIYNLGIQAYEAEDWDEAIKAFERVLLIPGFGSAPEARLYIARAQFNQERFILARSEFQRVLDRYPGDTVAPHAGLGMCESYARLSPIPQRDQGPTRNAWTTCGQVARDYAGTLVGLRAAEVQLEMYDQLAQADYQVGEHYFKRKFFDAAIIYYEDVVEEFPDSKWAAWAMYKMVMAFERIGYEIDAAEWRDRLIATYPESEPAELIRDRVGG